MMNQHEICYGNHGKTYHEFQVLHSTSIIGTVGFGSGITDYYHAGQEQLIWLILPIAPSPFPSSLQGSIWNSNFQHEKREGREIPSKGKLIVHCKWLEHVDKKQQNSLCRRRLRCNHSWGEKVSEQAQEVLCKCILLMPNHINYRPLAKEDEFHSCGIWNFQKGLEAYRERQGGKGCGEKIHVHF